MRITGVGYFSLRDWQGPPAYFELEKHTVYNRVAGQFGREPIQQIYKLSTEAICIPTWFENPVTFTADMEDGEIRLTTKCYRQSDFDSWHCVDMKIYKVYAPGLFGWLRRIADGKLPYFAFGKVVKVEWRKPC